MHANTANPKITVDEAKCLKAAVEERIRLVGARVTYGQLVETRKQIKQRLQKEKRRRKPVDRLETRLAQLDHAIDLTEQIYLASLRLLLPASINNIPVGMLDFEGGNIKLFAAPFTSEGEFMIYVCQPVKVSVSKGTRESYFESYGWTRLGVDAFTWTFDWDPSHYKCLRTFTLNVEIGEYSNDTLHDPPQIILPIRSKAHPLHG